MSAKFHGSTGALFVCRAGHAAGTDADPNALSGRLIWRPAGRVWPNIAQAKTRKSKPLAILAPAHNIC
jgi:hypothetical protein